MKFFRWWWDRVRWRRGLLLKALLGLVAIWLLGDFVHSRVVAARIARWEATVTRDADGVEQNCQAYTVGGGKTALLLIHGINSSPRYYENMASDLAERGYSCRVMRLPGFAEPTRRYARATREDWLAEVDRELVQLKKNYPRVAMVAHSLSGAVAIAHVLENPEAADAIVLLAPAVQVANHRSPLLSARAWHEIGQCLLLFTTVTRSPFGLDCHDPEVTGYPGRTEFTPVAVADELFGLIDNNRGRGEEFQLPLLMVLSQDDQVADWQAAETFYEQASSARKELLFLADSGHEIPLDNDWKQVAEEIAEFVEP